MSIVVQKITKEYGTQKALDQVSFEINSGQIVGFLGPNGAGKSTMMKILTGYIPQTSGKASVCGYDINAASMEVRKLIGYLPESNPLYLDMYVKEYLAFAAGMHGIRSNVDKLVAKMIEMTGLGLEQRKKIGTLSKGYKQRVGLAQALIHNPSVLILDEPTSGLDPNQLVDIRSLIAEIGKEKTVMLSTHIMQEVEAMCDRVIIINHGKIVANDEVSQLQSSVQLQLSYYTIEFDADVQQHELVRIKGIRQAKLSGTQTWEIEADAKVDVRGDLFKWAVQKNITVLTLKKSETKLEDVFRNVTNDGKKSRKPN